MVRLKEILKTLPPLEIPHPVPTTFYPFPRLPNELKNKIWGYAVSEPRYVRVYDFTGGSHLLRQNPRIDGQHPVPPILHVNHQAREEGLRYYSRCAEKRVCRSKWKLYNYGPRPNRRVVFINFSIDSCFYEDLPGPTVLDVTRPLDAYIPIEGFNFHTEIMKKFRHVAVEYNGQQRRFSVSRTWGLLVEDKMINLTIVAQDWTVRAMPESVAGDLFRKIWSFHVQQSWRTCGLSGWELNII
ncbi:uncharacterized protein PAC_12420 [Phialocephala subalpina]|uniref:2EXR domain-containing protein n=1 Tax=Phialocephala subalpina TaxID=576137 RepID=A0A1L7XBX0_9HELO|nr:uncharacterized protein PAC_12420 [Phialocephala subalpina]